MAYGAYFLALLSGNNRVMKKTRRAFQRMQADAFYNILKHQEGRRTQIRLLDSPLREFFDDTIIDEAAEGVDVGREYVQAFKKMVSDSGGQRKDDRGVILGLRHPEIYESQIEALFEAWKRLDEEGVDVDLKIFVPYVDNLDQVRRVKVMAESINDDKYGGKAEYDLGITLETVPAVLTAHKMLEMGVKQFIFGMNDLSQNIRNQARDSPGEDDYSVGPSGRLTLDPAIVEAIRGCLQKMAATGTSRGMYGVSISGEVNPVKLESLKELVPALDYVSASRPLQVPQIKLKLAQISVENYRDHAVSPQGRNGIGD
jgi:pyruvate,orthophosphate dikinase